jgi:small GTP-binding protein
MKVYDAGSIRNVAIVGHGGCGKTQLVSTLLFAAGAVNRIGRVDEGSTVTDFDDEEIARKHTLSSSLAYAEWQKTKINFIDTPGFANFLTDARSALRVVEAALLVVDAVAGVEVQTEKLWAEAASLNLPRIVVLNRLDRERASLDRALESLRRDCAREIIPVQLPLGEEKAFIGVVDLVKMKAQTFAADDRNRYPGGARRHRPARARAADRDGRRGRRAVDGNLLCGRDPHPGAVGRRASCGNTGRQAVPTALHIGNACDRYAAAARCHRQLRTLAGRA